MRRRFDDHNEREAALDRDAEREPTKFRASPLPRRNMAQRARFADIMCGAITAEEVETDAGVLQPPVKLAGAA